MESLLAFDDVQNRKLESENCNGKSFNFAIFGYPLHEIFLQKFEAPNYNNAVSFIKHFLIGRIQKVVLTTVIRLN